MLLKIGEGRALLDEGEHLPNIALFCTVLNYQTQHADEAHPSIRVLIWMILLCHSEVGLPHFGFVDLSVWKLKISSIPKNNANVTYQRAYIRFGIVKRATYILRRLQVSRCLKPQLKRNLFVHQNVELIVLWSVPGARGWDIYWARNLSTKNSCFIIPVVSTEQP